MGNKKRKILSERWSECPYDLLELVANRLAVLELIAFRGVCRNWRSASARASAIRERTPWFLMYGNSSKCHLFDMKPLKSYTMHIPELDGSTCIASSNGWLLLYRESSVCFFCPFSRTKIDLPQFPHVEVTNHIGVFTSAPTSPDCVVGVITHYNDKFELHTLERGSSEWVKHIYKFPSKEKITSAIFFNGSFYFLDCKHLLLKFDLKDSNLTKHRAVARHSYVVFAEAAGNSYKNIEKVPFLRLKKVIESNLEKALGWEKGELENVLGLEKGDFLSTCGTVEPDKSGKCYTSIENEDIAVKEVDVEDKEEDVRAKEEKEICYKKGVWISPRFFQLPPNQSWSF